MYRGESCREIEEARGRGCVVRAAHRKVSAILVGRAHKKSRRLRSQGCRRRAAGGRAAGGRAVILRRVAAGGVDRCRTSCTAKCPACCTETSSFRRAGGEADQLKKTLKDIDSVRTSCAVASLTRELCWHGFCATLTYTLTILAPLGLTRAHGVTPAATFD